MSLRNITFAKENIQIYFKLLILPIITKASP